jgi:hypothetical protein
MVGKARVKLQDVVNGLGDAKGELGSWAKSGVDGKRLRGKLKVYTRLKCCLAHTSYLLPLYIPPCLFVCLFVSLFLFLFLSAGQCDEAKRD